jgi:hypothetical protein
MKKRVLFTSICPKGYVVSGMLTKDSTWVIYKCTHLKRDTEKEYYPRALDYFKHVHATFETLDMHVVFMQSNNPIERDCLALFLHNHGVSKNIHLYYENAQEAGYQYNFNVGMNMSFFLVLLIVNMQITCSGMVCMDGEAFKLQKSLLDFESSKNVNDGEYTLAIAAMIYLGRDMWHRNFFMYNK